MDPALRREASTARLLLTYGVLVLIPVILLGAGLALGIRATATSRGLAEGRSEALLVAQTAVEPQLDGRPLSKGLSRRERDVMRRLARRALHDGHLLRLRLRDQDGRVVFSYGDAPGTAVRQDAAAPTGTGTDDEVVEATGGHVVVRLTHLNADSNDSGPRGPAAVEVYLPLATGHSGRQIGVLEMYLPYAPIASDVDAGLRVLYRDLGLGLVGLFVVLFIITLSVSRGLRRELAVNAWLARHDALTGLPNRALFHEHVARAAGAVGRTRAPALVAVMDLDHFKDFNDTLGHLSGDELLRTLARRLDAALSAPATIARLGGDEFGIVLRDLEDPRAELARLTNVVATEVEVNGLPLSVAPSVGYVLVTEASTAVETLMQRAEVAMYTAKADHTGIVEYSPEQEHFAAADIELIAEMPQALKDGQFTLHYQPQVDAASGEIVGAEALVRWQHPVQGLLAPGRFLPMAEQTDLIERLTAWVLQRSLSDAATLAAQDTAVPISVNVSARSVVRSDFAQEVIDVLQTAQVPAAQLVIEVTETTLLTNPERARQTLAQLDQAGVHVSMDDFGQGQTSLGYLAALPLRELKIDRGFVTGMAHDRARTAIVQSVIDLGHHLGMRVVAEGVETLADLSAVRALGCDIAQGYHIARPMPFADLADLLARDATPA